MTSESYVECFRTDEDLTLPEDSGKVYQQDESYHKENGVMEVSESTHRHELNDSNNVIFTSIKSLTQPEIIESDLEKGNTGSKISDIYSDGFKHEKHNEDKRKLSFLGRKFLKDLRQSEGRSKRCSRIQGDAHHTQVKILSGAPRGSVTGSRSALPGSILSRHPSFAQSMDLEFDIQSLGAGDFESAYTAHQLSESEKRAMNTFDSFDYLPSNSEVFRDWIRHQPARLDWDRWVMMGLIGVTIGVIGFLLHQFIYLISEIKWKQIQSYISEGSTLKAWGWCLCYSVTLAAVSSASVVFISQAAAGSGIPEVIGFLNGIAVRRVLSLTAFCVKFFSCVLAVGAGLPVGPEGPMIHIGSTVGTGLSQYRSRIFRFSLPWFSRFKNSEDRRNFTTAGAAAGVSAAFGAPVGGLLFAMEEVSSFWSMKLGWMIFFCCTLATFTADIFNSSFNAFRIVAPFGLFQTDKYLVFKLHSVIPVNVIMFLPAVVLGMIGGVLGSMFTITNLKIARLRCRILARISNSVRGQLIVRFIEPPIIMALWATVTIFLPALFSCKPLNCSNVNTFNQPSNRSSAHALCPRITSNYSIDDGVQSYSCRKSLTVNDSGAAVEGEYNEVASLVNLHIQKALRLLYSRRTHYQFCYSSLLTVLPLYFLFSCWTAGSAIASGIVLPMLFIGGLYGRAVGRVLVDLYGEVPTDRYWQWIDPGALALIGSASFFSGVSRLTMSLAVIMIEITNDVAFLLPTMVAILIAKWIGDYISHPLYHSLLEHKGIPYLDMEPYVRGLDGKPLNLELFKAKDIMTAPVITLKTKESLDHLAQLLKLTSHGGFPVIKPFNKSPHDTYYGLINRTELSVILCHPEVVESGSSHQILSPYITYEQLSAIKCTDEDKLCEIIDKYTSNSIYKEIFVDLEPFINRSSPHVAEDFSLHRTYILFRTLGLRHLTVVDRAHRIVGLISRKDLIGFRLQQKLTQ